MDKSKIKFQACSNSQELLLTVKLDDELVYQGPLSEQLQEISTDVDNTDGERCLSITMSGKTPEHTEVDDQGNITKDHMIQIRDVYFDDIRLGQIFVEKSVYEHDFNGTGELIQDKFYGDMGCNGTIKLRFTTPVYPWILENT